jgi:hypothetical protein
MPELKERLQLLAKYDSVSAELLDTALQQESCTPNPQKPDDRDAYMSRANSWLSAQEAPPDVLILPAPASAGQIEAFITALPETSTLFILETSLPKAVQLFLSSRLEDHIANRKLRLALGSNEDIIDYQLITLLDLPKYPAIGLYLDNLTDPRDVEEYHGILMNIRDRIRMKTCNLSTLTHFGPLWQYNTLRNLPILLRSPGVKQLDRIFDGMPAVIVAAGPSLNRTLPYIKEMVHRSVIIAVGTALKPLLKAGIIPDLVVTVDARVQVLSQFDIPCCGLNIAASFITHPDVLSRFERVFTGYVHADPLGMWINSQLSDKGSIMAGGTVTATAIDIAVRMGCQPIMTTGMDLCMADDGKSHADSTMYHGHKIASNLIPVPGNYSTVVHTSTPFRTYIEVIGDLVKQSPHRTFINVTDHGARIAGMELSLPAQMLRFRSAPFDAAGIIRKIHNDTECGPAENTAAIVTEWKDSIDATKNLAIHSIELCNSVIMAMKNPGLAGTTEIKQHLDQIAANDNAVMDNKHSALLAVALRPIFYQMGSKLEVKSALESHSIEAARRSRTLFEQIAGAATWTSQLLENAASEIADSERNADLSVRQADLLTA